MKIKLSDYIADFFAENGIRTIFTVVGGGAMHMNDSFGHHKTIKCIYNHHEQACAIAAEAYFRVNNEMAGVCVTSGPGAINALNGVVGAYQDSIPMIVVSGQTKTSLLTVSSGLPLRTYGNQEFNIVSALENVCKYSKTVMKKEEIRYCLEKAFHIALSGRPGPCWLDIPLDIQGAMIETDELEGYSCNQHILEVNAGFNSNSLSSDVLSGLEPYCESEKAVNSKIELILEKLKKAKRPVIYAGNGVRIAAAVNELKKLAELINVPVVTCWDSIDLMNTDSDFFAGRAGIMGDRSGNFAVQNSDLLICIGNRLNIYQIGYQYELWAREAYKVMVDIDPLELLKPTIKIDMPICFDAKRFISIFISKAKGDFSGFNQWILTCNNWKINYPVVNEKQIHQEEKVNVYGFMDVFSKKLPDNSVTVVANGSASVVGSASYYIKENQRFIMNCALSSMGYDLPASVGAAVAARQPNSCYDKNIICIAGDGSIQMNLQELQTIVTNNLPVKIVVINNQGYHQIRLTQTNIFNKNFVGLGPESNDLDFPDFSKLSYAYSIPYFKCDNSKDMPLVIDSFLKQDGFALLEVFCDTKQIFEPKSATKRLEDGSLYSPPLEDLYPFLDRNELKNNMFIKMIDE